MTQEQKDKLEQAADALFEHKGYSFTPCDYAMRKGFLAGAQTILENPIEWGLVESSVMETCRKLRLRITEHEAENQRLREALEKISTPIHGEYPDIETVNWIAKEALKQEEEK